MPRSRLHNYLRTERLRSGFTQQELADLLGISRAVITKSEGTRSPSLELLLVTEITFGSSQSELFPGLYVRLVGKLLMRATAMEHRLQGLDDPVSRKKRLFLGQLIERAKSKLPQP
jgi:transcriptional regulator with XRE-family HTH domain